MQTTHSIVAEVDDRNASTSAASSASHPARVGSSGVSRLIVVIGRLAPFLTGALELPRSVLVAIPTIMADRG
jgi:hypothetical protein